MDFIKEEPETDSGLDSDSELDVETPPQEALPDSPVYEQRLRRDLGEVRRELDELASMIRDYNTAHGPYSTLTRLHKETEAFRDFKIQTHRIVGFIGDSGVGKSSIVNSLLDQKSIARSGGDGAACTSVVTEFRYIDDTHQKPYTIEVRFMSPGEIRELLEELLRSFRIYYSVDQYEEDADSPEDRRNFKEKASRAWVTLQSMLPDTEKLTEDFLASAHEGAWNEIIAKLEELANESLARIPGEMCGQVVIAVTDGLQSCKDRLDLFMSKSNDKEHPTLWPFINIVRVYLDAPILRTGLVLADLPGFRDMNYARVRAAERYLLHQCDEVFIVSSITRCCTDQSILDIKRRCNEKPNHIICTRSEDVSPDEEARGETDYSKQVKAMNLKIYKCENRIEKENSTRHKEKRRKTEGLEKLAALRDQLEEEQLRRNQFLVDTRNSRVKALLRDAYGDSKVFCVSNKLYSRYRSGRSEQAEQYTKLSGISELRDHCFLVPATKRFRAISAYLTHQIPGHLGSLRQWTLVAADFLAVTNAEELKLAFDGVEALLHRELLSPQGHITCLMDNLIEKFKTTILEFTRRHEEVWRGRCLQASDEWATWYHTTHTAFCRNNGTFTSGGEVGYHSWNEELAFELKDDLETQWDSIEEWLNQQNAPLSSNTSETLKQAYDILLQHERAAPRAIRNTLRIMASREKNIVHDMETCIQDVLQATGTVCSDMCYGHDSSFLGSAMRPVYLACTSLTGRGGFQKRKEIIRDAIKKPDMLHTYRQTADREYTSMIKGHFDTLSTNVRLQIDGIANDLAPIVDQTETPRRQKIPGLIENLKTKVDGAEKVLEAAQRALNGVS